jgi:hypothetical protein
VLRENDLHLCQVDIGGAPKQKRSAHPEGVKVTQRDTGVVVDVDKGQTSIELERGFEA